MQNCLDCATPVNSRCVTTEVEFSSKETNLDKILLDLDKQVGDLKKALSAKIDFKSFKEQESIYLYIQEIINRVDTLTTNVSTAPSNKITINSSLTGNEPKSLLQILTLFAKEIEALKSKNVILGSSLYLPSNV